MTDSLQLLEERPRSTASPSLTSLFTEILGDVQKLLEQQFALVRHELHQDMRQTSQAVGLMAIGAALALIAGVGFLFAAAYGLSWAFPSIPFGGSLTLVGAVLAVIAIALIAQGMKKLDSLNLRLINSSPAKE